MRGRAEHKVNAAKGKTEEKEKVAAKAKISSKDVAAASIHARIRGCAARKTDGCVQAQCNKKQTSLSGSDQPRYKVPEPKRGSSLLSKSTSKGNPTAPKRSAAKEGVKGAKDSVKNAKDSAMTTVSGKVAKKADTFIEKNVMKVLGNVGEMVKEGSKAPGMPKFMTNYTDSAHEFLWDDVERELCEGVNVDVRVSLAEELDEKIIKLGDQLWCPVDDNWNEEDWEGVTRLHQIASLDDTVRPNLHVSAFRAILDAVPGPQAKALLLSPMGLFCPAQRSFADITPLHVLIMTFASLVCEPDVFPRSILKLDVDAPEDMRAEFNARLEVAEAKRTCIEYAIELLKSESFSFDCRASECYIRP